jgi:topoisomerase-4 subunit A
MIATSSGRFYTLPVYKLPKHKQAELLRLLIDMDPKDEVVNVLLLPTDLLDKHAIILLKEGKGFKVQGEQLLSYTKMGKQIATGEVVNILWEQDHHDVLLLGHNRRMIILKIDDIPTLKKGQGVNLLKATIVYANLVDTKEPLVWMRGERSYKIADFRPWQLKRGSAGRLAPIGFFRN